MLRMGIEALYRRPCTTKPEPGHKVYPYLLRSMEIARPNQVWAMDITYIPMTESLQMLQPIGVDRWGYDLAIKYGVRDAFICPVGGRWVLIFWAAKPAAKDLSPPARILLYTAASFAAMRIDQLVGSGPASKQPLLTPRQLAVLRLLSIGAPFKEAAEQLQLGEETVRTHLKKAQAKLGVRNRTHAVGGNASPCIPRRGIGKSGSARRHTNCLLDMRSPCSAWRPTRFLVMPMRRRARRVR